MLSESFSMLGIDESASLSDVRFAYMSKAQKMHPDMGGDASQFSMLVVAYHECLEHTRQASCPHCVSGRKKIQKGFAVLEIICEICGGSGRREK